MPQVPVSLTMRVVGPEPTNPVTIYHQAAGFYLAGHRCLLYIPTGPKTGQSLVIPSIVNFVFSIELFLKSVLVKNGKNKKGHKIKELLGECPVEIIDKIRKQYSQVCVDPNFDRIINIVNDMFVKLRYQYEYNITGLYDSAVFNLANVLYIICEELYEQK